MMLSWRVMVIAIASQILKGVIANYHCTIQIFEVICHGLQLPELNGNISASIKLKSDISSLSISDGNIPEISAATFENFTMLQSLHISNSHVAKLENEALAQSPLVELLLSNNLLTEFNARSLSVDNQLRTLDLSNNLLQDLSDFNISYLPKLAVLNLTNNMLTYLPIDFIDALEAQNDLYIIGDNNPWNCSHPDWSDRLSEELVLAFCANNSFNYAPQTGEIVELIEEKTDGCEKINCYKCSFYYCLLWMFCGIWIGIILGNVGKIRTIICSKPVTYTDGHTQCEYSLVEQHMVSGVFDTTSHKFTPLSTLGTSVQKGKT